MGHRQRQATTGAFRPPVDGRAYRFGPRRGSVRGIWTRSGRCRALPYPRPGSLRIAPVPQPCQGKKPRRRVCAVIVRRCSGFVTNSPAARCSRPWSRGSVLGGVPGETRFGAPPAGGGGWSSDGAVASVRAFQAAG